MDGKVEDSAEADPSGASEDAPMAHATSLGPKMTVQTAAQASSNGTASRSPNSSHSDPELQATLPETPTARFRRQDSGLKGEYKLPGSVPPSLSVL